MTLSPLIRFKLLKPGYCFHCLILWLFLWLFLMCRQHNASRAAYEDAQQQMKDIMDKLKNKHEDVSGIQTKLEKNKFESLEAHKLEQVYLAMTLLFMFFSFFCVRPNRLLR